jgi:hypothetical protein
MWGTVHYVKRMSYVAPTYVIGCTEVSGNGAVSFFKHDTSDIFGYSNGKILLYIIN